MQHTVLIFIVTLLGATFLLKLWKVVLQMIAASLLALAIFGFLTLLAMFGGQ